ncbi:MAG: VCBS repeat-containing protein, partial [Planctomycetota bacterium]
FLAFVNPNFTPLHVVADAEHISHYQAQVEGEHTLLLDQGQRLKGAGEESLRIDISAIPAELREEEFAPIFAEQAQSDALVFIAAEGAGSTLHLGRYWATLEQHAERGWRVREWSDGHFLGAWDGGTDQLLRVVRYILDNPDPQVPALSGAEWSGSATVGQVEGSIAAMQMLHLGDDTAAQLFVASDAGDQLLLWDAEVQAFAAQEPALPSASQLAVWGAFTDHEHLSLVSQGDSLRHIWLQDGSWHEEAIAIDGLSAISGLAVAPGQRLLIAGAHGVAVAQRSDGQWTGQVLPAELPAQLLAGPVVVGEFTNAGHAELLLLHAHGALAFAADGDGGWEAGEAVTGAPALGAIRSAQAVDVDNNGLLDIIAIGEDSGLSLWHNQGEMQWRERRADAGEIRYIPNALVRDVITCDFNNDGRPDLVLLNPGMGPHIFYNRGFMVFGFAEDLVGGTLPREIYQGQQRGIMADITGDGAEELVTILEDGAILRLQRDTEGYMTMGAQLRLSSTAAKRGPIMLRAGDEDRPIYAAHVLHPGESLFIGRAEPGPLFLRWRFPGEGDDWQEDMLIVEDGSTPVLITPEGLQQ